MSIFSKALKKGKNIKRSRKAPEGLKYLGEGYRKAYLIKDESGIRPRLLSNALGSGRKYPSFEGMVLKEADSDRSRKDNLKEYKTWNLLSQEELYREKLAKTFLCTEDGKFLVMERVKVTEGFDPEQTEFAKKMKEKIMREFGVKPGDVDIRGDAIGEGPNGYKIFDYPWISLE